MKTLTNRKLQTLLSAELSLTEPEFHLERWGNRVSGSIVAPEFQGMRDSERQRIIWDALEKHFGKDLPGMIGMLLAFSPEEWNIDLEGHHHAGARRRATSTRKRTSSKK
jgi:stress-induced morphogen